MTNEFWKPLFRIIVFMSSIYMIFLNAEDFSDVGVWDGVEGHAHEFDMGPGGISYDYWHGSGESGSNGASGGWKDCALEGPTVPKEFVVMLTENGWPEEPKSEGDV